MTNEEIIENNKLIAEFMGIDTKGMCYYIPEHEKPSNHDEGMTSTFFPNELEYHSSWDWLMPAAKECVSKAYDLSVPCPEAEKWLDTIREVAGQLDIQELYGTVVEFIKWYNEQENK